MLTNNYQWEDNSTIEIMNADYYGKCSSSFENIGSTLRILSRSKWVRRDGGKVMSASYGNEEDKGAYHILSFPKSHGECNQPCGIVPGMDPRHDNAL